MDNRRYKIYCEVCEQDATAYSGRRTTCDACAALGIKYCSYCGEVKNNSEFGVQSSAKDGITTYCRACNSERTLESRYRNHPDKDNEFWDRARAQGRKSREKLMANPIRRAERNASEMQYYYDNYADCEEYKTKQAKRAAKRRSVLGTFTTEEWVAALEHFEYQCAYCGETSNLTVEHIVPISKRGTSYIYNIIPACAHCNGSKGAKEIVEWYTTREFYSEHRLLKIHAWYMDMQKHLPILKDGENPSC